MPYLVITEDSQSARDIESFLSDIIVVQGLSTPVKVSEIEGFKAAFIDINIPLWSNLVKEIGAHMPVITFADPIIELAIESVRNGAIDFMSKPISEDALNRSLSILSKYEKRYIAMYNYSEDLRGSSPQMMEVRELIMRASRSDSNVLITGESGTGKEPVAKLIHKYSARKDKPFITVNCSAIPDTLFESELFGFEKGSFTGANYTKKGIIEMANEGTVFLDEIGDVSNLFQVKILRVLQEGEIMRIGSQRNTRVDVRFIAATNRDLKQECRRNRFREDLFYRLNVINIHMPPLRERKEDIPDLVDYFIKRHAEKRKDIKVHSISRDALEVLMNNQYQGNVRELENLIERAISFANSNVIDLSCFPANLSRIASPKRQSVSNIKEKMQIYERELIWSALQDSQGNISRAAQRLGLYRQELQRKLRKYKIAT